MSDKFLFDIISVLSKVNQNGLVQKIWYYVKKWYQLAPSKCIIIEPYATEHLTDKRFINLEKIYLTTLNTEQQEIMKRLYEQNEEVYQLFINKNLKQLFTALRWLNKNKPLYVICSSIELARLLHIKNENIHIIKASEQLFNIELEQRENQELLKRIRNRLSTDIIYYNYEELNDMLKRIN